MLTVSVLCVGKLKESYWRDACAEYQKRLGAYCRMQIVEVAEERIVENPSASQIASTIEAEGRRLMSHIDNDTLVVALCIEGKELDSLQLSRYLQKATVDGTSKIAFVIGGSWGLSETVKSRAALRLSMSPMTFPHQLARVMTLEQIYRAFQISSGGKYHK